jgi:hypothetical protein
MWQMTTGARTDAGQPHVATALNESRQKMTRSARLESKTLVVVGGVLLSACAGSSAPGTLVGKYEIRGVLVENTCGSSGLPAVNPLEFRVELREDDGLGYWAQTKSARNTGRISADGTFQFTVSQTQVLSDTTSAKTLEPGDFAGATTADFDLQRKTCAVSIVETIEGSLLRRQDSSGRIVTSTSASSSSAGASDLVADDTIEVTPSAGSDCNSQLAALGGNYLVLPCQATYQLRGALDTSTATEEAAGAGGTAAGSSASAGATAGAAGARPAAGSAAP